MWVQEWRTAQLQAQFFQYREFQEVKEALSVPRRLSSRPSASEGERNVSVSNRKKQENERQPTSFSSFSFASFSSFSFVSFSSFSFFSFSSFSSFSFFSASSFSLRSFCKTDREKRERNLDQITVPSLSKQAFKILPLPFPS